MFKTREQPTQPTIPSHTLDTLSDIENYLLGLRSRLNRLRREHFAQLPAAVAEELRDAEVNMRYWIEYVRGVRR